MQTLDTLIKKYVNLPDSMNKKLAKTQHKVAQKICNDVKSLAPVSTGEYVSSIQVGDTTIEDGVIKTAIFTDLTSEDDPNIVIGRMIEQGTGIYALEEHIGHTETFKKSGYRYWYVPATSVKRPIGQMITIKGKQFYVAKAQRARPHFLPALESNKKYYKDEIRKAVIYE